MQKSEALKHWRSLPPNQNPLPHMEAIPYKSEGSKYGASGIRIDGNPEFIDAVLSCLKPLIAGESVRTRLELSRRKVDGSGIGKALPNKDRDAEVCYIRLHVRGREGAIMAAAYGVPC
jgi:hypothetical protein